MVAGVKPQSQIKFADGFEVFLLRCIGRAQTNVRVANVAFRVLCRWFDSQRDFEQLQGAVEFLMGCRHVAAIKQHVAKIRMTTCCEFAIHWVIGVFSVIPS